MSSWAKPGVKCVCVDASQRAGRVWISGHRPFKGRVYTIMSCAITKTGNPGIYLEEVSLAHGGAYRIDRFRPLITQSDDIAMFKSLLTPALVGSRELERIGSD